ncbi:MAG: hypothetical protein HY921_05310 [Elusimicrobia bacterium]|nr:hypothetical protein [Elusimicrobiota bacterium]
MAAMDEALLRRLASAVGHELRNPLAVINNSGYFLKAKLEAGGSLDPKVRKHLDIIASEVARADALISDIVSWARPVQFELVPLPLKPCVEQALSRYHFPQNIRVEKKIGAGACEVPMDSMAFEDALRRILDNSVEAMPEGGRLRVSVFQERAAPVIEIRDSGPGFSEKAKASLFEPFFTTKPKGLGLGLALAGRTIEALGGKLEVRGAEGGGAAVRIRLGRRKSGI